MSLLDARSTLSLALPGTYQVRLVVSDGTHESVPDVVNVEALASIDAAMVPLMDAIEVINGLMSLRNADSGLQYPEQAKMLTDMLVAVLRKIGDFDHGGALNLLLGSELIGRTDGCETQGVPDMNDWIRYCEDQYALHALLEEVISLLT